MRIPRPVPALTLAALVASASVACSDDDRPAVTPPDRAPVTTFTATLSGAAERPTPVTTTGSGASVMTMRRDTIQFTLDVAGLDSVVAAHIHSGGPDVAGPVMIDLFLGPPTAAAFSGRLAAGTITRSTRVNVTGVTFDSVLTLMRTGNAYVNVHTRRRPGGEVRGQVVLGATR